MPTASTLILPRINTITFIHAFAWIFVLSSVIPAIILGKGRSVLLQFFLCLTVTFVAISVEDILTLIIGTEPTTQIQTLSTWFQNPIIAGLYLSAPYIFMLYLDIHERKKAKKEEKLQKIEKTYLKEERITEEREKNEAIVTNSIEKPARIHQPERKQKMTFLYVASVACFTLALVTFSLDNTIPATILAITYKPAYIAALTILGIILLGLGLCSTNIQEKPAKH